MQVKRDVKQIRKGNSKENVASALNMRIYQYFWPPKTKYPNIHF